MDLLSCPFCGGGAELKVVEVGEDDPISAPTVQCSKCGIATEPVLPEDPDEELESLQEKAQALWNRRVETSAPAATAKSEKKPKKK